MILIVEKSDYISLFQGLPRPPKDDNMHPIEDNTGILSNIELHPQYQSHAQV
jgi:hypothetical protein